MTNLRQIRFHWLTHQLLQNVSPFSIAIAINARYARKVIASLEVRSTSPFSLASACILLYADKNLLMPLSIGAGQGTPTCSKPYLHVRDCVRVCVRECVYACVRACAYISASLYFRMSQTLCILPLSLRRLAMYSRTGAGSAILL